MKKRVLGEIVNAYADNLRAGDCTADRHIARYPDDDGVLGDLLRLTDEIAALLTPVRPAHGFVRRLDQSLSAGWLRSLLRGLQGTSSGWAPWSARWSQRLACCWWCG